MILLLLIVVGIFFIFFQTSKKSKYVIKKILKREECQDLIEHASKEIFSTENDPVDDKPVYQIEMLQPDGTIQYPELYEKCMHIYNKKLSKTWGKPDFIFLKRYKPGERVDIPPHRDECSYTHNILLSDPNEYEGGDFYFYEDSSDPVLRKITRSDFTDFANVKLPIIQMKQGEVISYEGIRHVHGVLPVTKGERYVLTYFFGHSKNRPNVYKNA